MLQDDQGKGTGSETREAAAHRRIERRRANEEKSNWLGLDFGRNDRRGSRQVGRWLVTY